MEITVGQVLLHSMFSPTCNAWIEIGLRLLPIVLLPILFVIILFLKIIQQLGSWNLPFIGELPEQPCDHML